MNLNEMKTRLKLNILNVDLVLRSVLRLSLKVSWYSDFLSSVDHVLLPVFLFAYFFLISCLPHTVFCRRTNQSFHSNSKLDSVFFFFLSSYLFPIFFSLNHTLCFFITLSSFLQFSLSLPLSFYLYRTLSSLLLLIFLSLQLFLSLYHTHFSPPISTYFTTLFFSISHSLFSLFNFLSLQLSLSHSLLSSNFLPLHHSLFLFTPLSLLSHSIFLI